ncbi:MAG: CopG family antitoxin [Rubrobacteraceae bacterium]
MKKITDPSQIPQNMTEEQARDFWDSHEITEEYLSKASPAPEGNLPKLPPRTKPISIRLDEDTLGRLKKLAEIKNKGYQTLLKEFVSERLYEEEKREGLVPSSSGQKYITRRQRIVCPPISIMSQGLHVPDVHSVGSKKTGRVRDPEPKDFFVSLGNLGSKRCAK